MTITELDALADALRDWRFVCEPRYLQDPPAYTFAIARHYAAVAELPGVAASMLACERDVARRYWL